MAWVNFRAWAGSASPGRCKYCRRAIVWVMSEHGKPVPLDMGFTIREVVVSPQQQARFLVLDRADRHDCPERRAEKKVGRTLTLDRKSERSTRHGRT